MRAHKILLATALLAGLGALGWAQSWGFSAVANISATMGVNDGRVCIGEASRQDIGCPTYAPSINAAGLLTATSIATGGLTVTGATSLSTVSATVGSFTSLTVNGVAVTGGGGGGGGDRLTSGTSSVAVNSATGVVSVTQLGVETAYLHPTLGLVAPGVSTTGAISASRIYAGENLQLASPTAVTACNASTAGSLRYNSPTTTIELCTGSGWQPMGVGIPAGTISAFASTTCPTGWSEYTAARGRFLRGIDNGAGNDPSGTRAPGTVQADLVGAHVHNVMRGTPGSGGNDGYANNVNFIDTAPTTNSFGGAETRPRNVAVIFCQFNGTSNGWNNPLSGGSTTPGGSTGQIQYNNAGAFSASANLAWTNASNLLTVTGTLSATNVYGLSVSGTTGFFPSLSAGAIATNSISSTNVSATVGDFTTLRVNGVAVTGGGGSTSPTNVPAFSVHRNGVLQMITAGGWAKVNFTTEVFDTQNSFSTANSRFTPQTAGRYLINLTVSCNSSPSCYAGIYKNGVNIHQATGGIVGHVSHIVDMNGTTDYIEGYVYSSSNVLEGTIPTTNMTGSLLASGSGTSSSSTVPGG